MPVITTIEEANAFLAAFINEYNNKFAVEPRDPQSAFRKLKDSINLNYILCIKDTRQVDNGSAFSYQGVYYRVIRNGKVMPVIPKAKVTVLKSPQFGLKVEYSGSVYDVEVLDAMPLKEVISRPPKQPRKAFKPPEDHPWRTSLLIPSTHVR